jgi:hypothetical protein
MSRGYGRVERRILNVLAHEAVGVAIPALAEALPDVPVRGLRRAVQRLERQGQLHANFQATRHEQSWGGISRVKVVSLAQSKVDLQDGGPSYTPDPPRYERGRYLERSRKQWQAMERKGYTRLPGVRKRDVYEAIGAVIHWYYEAELRHCEYDRAWRPIGPTKITGEEVRRQRAVWQQAQTLLDQARLQLTTLIKAPHIHREQRERPTDHDRKDRLDGEIEGTSHE